MATQITQAQYNTAKQPIRNIHIRVELLDFKYRVISSFEGNVIAGSLSSDSTSDVRNSCDITMVVTDRSFNVAVESKIWLDRLIKIYVGVDDMRNRETAWTNKGIYLINQPSYQYDAETNTLSFSGVDLMAKMTGLRGGYLKYAYKVPQGSSVRDVMRAVLSENGFDRYVINDCVNVDGTVQNVPYDMEFDIGSTWYNILSALVDILPNYQIYFDVDGVFHYEPVPYRANEPIRMTQDIWKDNVISESVDYDFEAVKNSIKVLGATHDTEYYSIADYWSLSGGYAVAELNIPQVTEYADNMMIGFSTMDAQWPQNRPPYKFGVNNLTAVPLVDADGNEYNKSFELGTYYVMMYQAAKNNWLFIGRLQAEGEYKDTNPDSPFYIGNPAGEIPIVLYGGDYENIQTDDLAYQRAKWEIYRQCRLNDTIQLTTIPIYWAEVNWMVTYTPLGSDTEQQYLIKSISTSLEPDGEQTYELVKYYPYYE